jgi:integrase
MGHGSKKMVYEVYGDYIEGLEEDYWKILEYMGKDFIQPKGKTPAIFQNRVESSVESQGPNPFIYAV